MHRLSNYETATRSPPRSLRLKDCKIPRLRTRRTHTGRTSTKHISASTPPGARREHMVFSDHDSEVDYAAFSPGGEQIVTASAKRAQVWDMETGKLKLTLEGHMDLITSAVDSPKGDHILTASFDHTARVWNATDGRLLYALKGPEGHTNQLRRAAFSPDGTRIVTASEDETAKVWNAETGEFIRTIAGDGAVQSAAFSPDGLRIITGSDKTAQIWDVATANRLHRGHIRVLFMTHSLTRAATGLLPLVGIPEARFGQWTTINPSLLSKAIRTSCSPLSSARKGPASLPLLPTKLCGYGTRKTGTELQALSGHQGGLNVAVFSPSGSHILTASDDRTARRWNVATGGLIHSLTGHGGKVIGAFYNREGTRAS